MQRLTIKPIQVIKEKKSKTPTYLHDVVSRVCLWLYGTDKDSRCFAMWLGIGKRCGAGQLDNLLKQVKEKEIKSPQYLLACVKKR